MPTLTDALVALAPSVGVGLIFFFVMRSILRADARERAATARMEAQAQEKHAE